MRLKEIWIKACEWDSINPDAKFVVFSDENPWAARYNKAVGLVQRSRIAFEADKARRRASCNSR